MTASSFPSAHYHVEQVSEGVYAALARLEGTAVCNSGIVDLGGGRLLFDSSCSPASAQDLSSLCQRALNGGPSLAAISHWHLDHSVGCYELASVPIWGTKRTREILLEMRPQLEAELTREELEKGIQEIEGHRDEMKTDGARLDLEFCLYYARSLLAAAGRVKITPPSETFETHLDLPGTRKATLASFGSGHTEADAVLFLPHEKLLFAGDLVISGVQPSLGSGNPDHWLEVLDQIDRIGAEQVVPGHGPVLRKDATHETRDYVSSVLRAAEVPATAALPLPIRRWEGSLSLKENLAFARGWVDSHRTGR